MSKILIWVLIAVGVLGIVSAGSIGFYYFYYTAVSEEMMFDKPAIYLYPQQDMQIQVTLNLNGEITKDIPTYQNGWNVFTTKEGLIENRYDYLFYECKLNKIQLPNEGWVIKQEDLYKWFDTHLPKLGLNQKEIIQFKEYWLFELTKANYYEIKLFDKEFLNKNMQLTITPQPDTQIRIMFSFKPLKEPYILNPPQITTPKREGFTVVEWGGMVQK